MFIKDILLHLYTNTKEIVTKQLTNASSYEVSLIQCVLQEPLRENFDVRTFSKVVTFIEKENFDMSNFFLYNSTSEGTYTFMSMDFQSVFDIGYCGVNDIDIMYMDENYNQQKCSTIKEAISNYKKSDLVKDSNSD